MGDTEDDLKLSHESWFGLNQRLGEIQCEFIIRRYRTIIGFLAERLLGLSSMLRHLCSDVTMYTVCSDENISPAGYTRAGGYNNAVGILVVFKHGCTAIDFGLILDTIVDGLEKYSPFEEYDGPMEPVSLSDITL